MSEPPVPPLVPSPRTAPPAPPRRGAWGARVIVGLVVIGAAIWYLRSRHQDRASQAQPGEPATAREAGRGGRGGDDGRVVPVQVAKVERKDLPIWLEGLGSVAAVQQVTVRPQVDGRIDRILFVEGQPVKKGDVLVQIDPRPFLVALHQAEGALARDRAQLETNQVNLKRYQGLQAQNLVAGQQVEEIAGLVGQFEGAVKIDQAQIESAKLQLDYAQVKAPLDGIAGIRQVDAGNLIHQADTNGIVVITAIDPAAVFFTLPQDQLTSVAQALARGDVPVEAYSRDGVTRLAVGKLAVLDNQVNQSTATLRLKALMPNPSRALWPNAFVKARMLVETRHDAVVVPTVAIQRGPQGTFVYVVAVDKTAQMRPVTIAMATGDVTVVARGLEGGELVIVEGQNQVRPGSKVSSGGSGGGAGMGGGSGEGRSGAGRQRASAGAPAESPPGAGSAGSAAPEAAPSPRSDTGAPPAAPSSDATRPRAGQPRSRSPVAGPTASLQPATPPSAAHLSATPPSPAP